MAEHADATVELTVDAEGMTEAESVTEADPSGEGHRPRGRIRGSRLAGAAAVGLGAAVVLSALGGWLGYQELGQQREQQRDSEMVEAARQGAVNLTTIDFTSVDADVQRILDSAAGTFHDDFAQRAQPFIDVVKQAKSKTEGTVTGAALESLNGDQAQVLVSVAVKTSNDGKAEPDPRSWRMRVSVHRDGDSVKVTDVQFVP